MPKKIALVEDDVDCSLILHKILSNAGYTVDTFAEGTPIVENKFSLPDIFILDNFMPMIHGIALCKYLKLKANTKSIPVIIISANKQLKSKAEQAGATFFLGKPFHTNELLSFVEAVLKEESKAEENVENELPREWDP